MENGILQDVERPLNPNDSFYTRKQKAEEAQEIIPGSVEGTQPSQMKMIDGGMDESAMVKSPNSMAGSQSNIKASRSLN